MVKKFGIVLLIIFIIIQFFRIDKSNPPVVESKDFITVEMPPPEIKSIIRQACYDCHSHQSEYPWYSNLAPVSWWMKKHIDNGREHLNFSLWADYDQKEKDHKMEEIAEEVGKKQMPITPYLVTHSEARLTDEQRQLIVNWFERNSN